MEHQTIKRLRRRIALRGALGLAALVAIGVLVSLVWYEFAEKRSRVVDPGKIYRGAWQRPTPFRRILKREGIRTVLTLTAINRHDPKYVEQDKVVRDADLDWILVPMRGSTATLEQLAMAADIAADPRRQPVFFHCVAGHHRSNLVQAAIRIRYQGWSAEQAWEELRALPWTGTGAEADAQDRALIVEFARAQGSIPPTGPSQVREFTHASSRQTRAPMDLTRVDPGNPSAGPRDRLD